MQRVTRSIARVLSSRRFGIAVLIFFVFEALWVAFSAVYPMAFDEDFHFGLIKFYSHHWSPFLSAADTSGTGQFGPVMSDPSYLYHYLLSFPYRLLHAVIPNETAIILVLRAANVALFAFGLVLFYKLLRRVGASRLLTNTALALFVLIPIVPLLAAHINYDNLLFVLTAWTCWLVVYITEDLRQRAVNLKTVGLLSAVLLLSCLVKYAFLPIAGAAAIWLVVQFWRAFHGRGAQLRAALRRAYSVLGRRAAVGFVLLLVVCGGLFAQRYAVNLARYHAPVPECEAVLDVDTCLAYGPWARNYTFANNKGPFNHSPLFFTKEWLKGMHRRTFFMVTGPTRGYVNYPPMPILGDTATVLALAGVVGLAVWGWKVVRWRSILTFLFLVTVLYCATLWLNGYKDYLATGRAVAINGRYLLVVLLPFVAVAGQALALGLRRWPLAKPWVAAAVIVLFLQGGGLVSFIVRSDERWDWPNRAVVHVNNAARQVLQPLVIEGKPLPK